MLIINLPLPPLLCYSMLGYLYALLFVLKHVGADESLSKLSTQVAQMILRRGRGDRNSNNNDTFKSPLMYEWHEKKYLAAAHGISGILYTLMEMKELLADAQVWS